MDNMDDMDRLNSPYNLTEPGVQAYIYIPKIYLIYTQDSEL